MPRFRIFDSHKPGYIRIEPEGSNKTTPPGQSGQASAPVISQVQAEVRGQASAAVPLPPVITVQPVGATVNDPTAVNLSIEAISDSAMTYQWFLNGSPISGATSSSYNTGATTPGTRVYTCQVTNAGGTTTSNTATVIINASTPTYRYFRFIMASEPPGAEVDWNEIEFYSGANGNGTKVNPIAGTKSVADGSYPASILFDGNTANSTGGGQYSAFFKPVTGKYFQIDIGPGHAVASIRLFVFTMLGGAYFVNTIHIDASTTGSTWVRLKSNYMLPLLHQIDINL